MERIKRIIATFVALTLAMPDAKDLSSHLWIQVFRRLPSPADAGGCRITSRCCRDPFDLHAVQVLHIRSTASKDTLPPSLPRYGLALRDTKPTQHGLKKYFPLADRFWHQGRLGDSADACIAEAHGESATARISNAIGAGHEGCVRSLLHFCSGKELGFEALRAAIQSPAAPTLLHLLHEHGAALEVSDDAGWHPIHVAVQSNKLPAVRTLATLGVNVGTPIEDRVGLTPLHLAARLGDPILVEGLLELGAYANQGSRASGETPIFDAVRAGSLECIRALHLRGGDVNRNGTAPLHVAAESRSGAPVVRLLLALGANVNTFDDSGNTPLHVAAGCGATDSVEALCDAGADVDSKTQSIHMTTPLIHASWGGYTAAVRILIARGADVNYQDYSGARPLYAATCGHHEACVAVLTNHGAK